MQGSPVVIVALVEVCPSQHPRLQVVRALRHYRTEIIMQDMFVNCSSAVAAAVGSSHSPGSGPHVRGGKQSGPTLSSISHK